MKKIITTIIGFLILGILLYSFGIEEITSILLKTNITYFILAAISFLFVEIFSAIKLKLVSPLKFSQLFLSHMGGMFFSQITPARSGYFYTSYSLGKKENKNVSEKIGLITLVQAIMMISKIFLIIIALIYFSFLFEIPNYLFLTFLMPIVIAVMAVYFLYFKSSKKLLSKIPFIKRFVKYLEMMQKAVKAVSKKKAFGMIVLDFISWLFFGLQFFFLASALGIFLPFIICLMLQPLLTAILFIPISPNALGLAESGNALMFVLLGFPASIGVVFLLLFRINSLIVDSIGIIDMKTIKIPKNFNSFKN